MNKINITFIIPMIFMVNTVFGQDKKVESLIQEGIEQHDNGEYKKAIEIYQKALKIDPNSSLANYEISLSYFTSKDYKNAEAYSKKVIDLDNDHILAAYITYGNSLDMQGQKKQAIEAYEKAMEDFDNYLLYYNHAIACFNSGDTDKAYESALKAIENNSSHGSSHLVLSKIMEIQGSRIKAMLPLYYFLLLEPNSSRSKIEYQRLKDFMSLGISQKSESEVNAVIPMDDDTDFSAAEMMVSLSNVSNSLEGNKEKSDLELFVENNDRIFKILGELKKENSGFWWEFYVPLFYEMAEMELTRPFSYYISLSQGDEIIRWIEDNEDEFQSFENWINN